MILLALVSCLAACFITRRVDGPSPILSESTSSVSSKCDGSPLERNSFRGTASDADQPVLSVFSDRSNGSDNNAFEEPGFAAETVPLQDIPAVLDLLSRRSDEPACSLRHTLIRRWAESDAAAAAEWLTRSCPPDAIRECVVQVATAWAGTDAAAATQWAEGLPAEESRTAALTSIAYETARNAPVSALDLAIKLPSGAGRDELLVFGVSQWAAADPNSAAIWATAVQDPSLKQKLLAAIAMAWAETDGVQGAALLANMCSADEEQDRAAVAVIQRWAEHAPREAASWLVDFPDTSLRRQAAETLVQLWARQDVQAVAEWLQALPEGTLRSSATAAYARTCSEQAGRNVTRQ